MRASHILVSTLEEANEVLAQVSPDNFGTFAKRYSSCPSKMQGGDLGDFGPGQMVLPFEKATIDTPVGKISQPVQTQFGYHIIHRTG
jgi:peptidyl-prolyl cis-trans isomerase C